MESKFEKKSLCVIIPMYNEEDNAEKCVREVIKVIKTINIPIMLLLVNDGSSDKTLLILEKEAKRYKVNLSILSHNKNRGYGAALQTGTRYALEKHFDYALFMDSDLTNNPRDISRFVKKIKENPDCVKASRYIKGGKIRNVPLKRRFFSRLGNIIASYCFDLGIHDYTNGFRMINLSLFKGINFHERSFSIILEELYFLKKKKAKVLEIPVTLDSRKKSKSHFPYRIDTFYNYAKYAIKALSI